ncbi:AraC family transcriptional regulator [Sphingomonas naphthae]|uniref:AraC family transcriptional regulator n=1 Tax=Sphingomonas naphthae TaxID=1813468 RepID=A0ABY7TK64_9SPHN|nr:AraC family transcriptional regulator [Sphingomonas naphthae]WCT73549.1 AraC family transcriptional regulator [Sphingomonas naphthae]
MRDTSLDLWHQRIGRAAALLTARLDDPPALEELASAAAVSPFHFHRIWRALTGETVAETVRRLRIEGAQAMLAAGGGSVTEAAMASGFGTPQSFARAFRRQTGMSPSDWRARPALALVGDRPPAPIEIVWRDAIEVVALRRTGGAYANLNASFQAVWDWAEGAGRLEGFTGLYGIPHDDPASVPVDALRYDACLALGAASPPAPFHSVTLAAGDHAVIRHVGDYDALEAIDQYLVGEWLPASGREPADAPLIHHFLTDPENTPVEQWTTDVLLPLRP